MAIRKVIIENFKCYKGKFTIELNKSINILVGNNEAGKSTVLEAINLAFTGLYDGRYAKNELTQHLFNNEVVAEYISKARSKEACVLPIITIEIYLDDDLVPSYIGNGNSNKEDACGFRCEIFFDERYQEEYEIFMKEHIVQSLPIEYYDIQWKSFARESITPRRIPIKSALIDSSSNKYRNGSDVYISRIIKNNLDAKEVIDVSQAHRKLRDDFKKDDSIQAINKKLEEKTSLTNKKVELSVELVSKNAWETSLTTYLDDVPFRHIGKGEQCLVKTELALKHKKSEKASVILIEEPENHLSHSRLNQLLYNIKSMIDGKQLIICTHSSFVANKLGLACIKLLNDKKVIALNDLSDETKEFFEKIAGYDTLRLILCGKAILVEGASDELVVQKAYMSNRNGKLPIEDGVDIISVGTAFLRFLEIATKLNKSVSVITDNDGDVEGLKKKYINYLGHNQKDFINICFDEDVDTGELKIGEKVFNYNTLEPKIVKENGMETMNKVLNKKFDDIDSLHKFMKQNKTECALKIFNSNMENFNYPSYILEAIKDE
jgi:putative ATP-dependent endonuclease of OLD family